MPRWRGRAPRQVTPAKPCPSAAVRKACTRSRSGSRGQCPGAAARAQVGGLLALEQPLHLPAHDAPCLVGVEPHLQRVAQRPGGRHRRRPVGSVAREQHLAGRDERHQRLKVGWGPPRRVEEQVRLLRRPRQIQARSQIPAWARIRRTPGRRRRPQRVAGRAPGCRGPRGRAPAAALASASANTARERRMVEREALGAGVELDPARARRQARSASASGSARVEPAKGTSSDPRLASASTMSLAAG